jgi:hypothetical protein
LYVFHPMGLVDKLFGGGKKDRKPKAQKGFSSDSFADLDIPVDEKFTIHFKKNGGKFIYCETFDEVLKNLNDIRKENNWESVPFFTFNQMLKDRFTSEHLSFTENPKNVPAFFSTCEHLIALNGSILVCSHQLMDLKVHEVPENIIVLATTSQLVETIGDGLKSIKNRYTDQIPANITTLNHFQKDSNEVEDFMTYGSSTKNLYLLLLEDL